MSSCCWIVSLFSLFLSFTHFSFFSIYFHINFFSREAFFQDDNNLYLLLEFLQGGELFSHLRKEEKFDSDIAKFYCIEVASALNQMHLLHIAYRDIKPENIMLGISSFFSNFFFFLINFTH